MEIYKIPIEVAFITFPFVAFLFTLPFLIYEYHKYGAIPLIKSIVVYSFILYILAAYFMVILPLPKISDVINYKGPTMQLIPFQFITDIKQTTNINFNNIQSILTFLNKSTVYTVLFNILLTVPFGVYLKYLFNKKWYQAIIASFGLSLFFEITQLSGLYGIYPRPYRLFDIDDLIINTLGGFIGYTISPLLLIFLPSRETLENQSYIKGKKVSLIRRGVAFFIDLVFLSLFSLIFKVILLETKISKLYLLFSIIFYYLIIPTFNNTKTFGKTIVKLEIISKNQKFTIVKMLIRNIIFTLLIVYPFSWLFLIENSMNKNILIKIILIIQIINILSYLFPFNKKHLFLYERITQTENKSVINFKEEINEKDINIEKENNSKEEDQENDPVK